MRKFYDKYLAEMAEAAEALRADMALPDGAAAIFSVATRFSQLDANGFTDAGAPTYVTSGLLKATLTPVIDSGVDIAIQDAAGNLAVRYKHGDMPKYKTISLEMTTPDPVIEQLLCGGVVFSDSSAALGLVTSTAVTGQTTLGTLPAGTYGYRLTQYNQYGESAAATEVQVTNTGSTSVNVISGTQTQKSLGIRVYGRQIGSEQYLGTIPNFGISGSAIATTSTSGTGAVTSLAVSGGLPQSIPQGAKFTITGDTNTPKIVFTTTAFAGIGSVSIPVSASQTVTSTIAAAALIPVFVDDGSIAYQVTAGPPSVDTTAGPGAGVGYQAPALGVVGNPNGVGIEFFELAVVNGRAATYLPYWRYVTPLATNLHVMPRTMQAANVESVYEGQLFENPNWGTGPAGDWQFDSTKVDQRARCSSLIVPTPSFTSVADAA